MELSIVPAAEAPDGAFPALEAHPYWGAFGRRYYAAVYGDARRCESFAVMDGATPALLVPCTVGDGGLDWFGLPIRIFSPPGQAREAASLAVGRALLHIEALAAEHGAGRIVLADEASDGTLSPLGEGCARRGAAAALRLTGICDIAHGEAGMRRGLRKSFKSLLNWGRRSLEIRIVSGANPDQALFARYQDLHRQVAGRVTRPQASWDAMFEWVAAGRGELILGFLGAELVTGTLAVDGNGIAAYASGVYDRQHFDKPLAHWPLWLVMRRSAERGNLSFDLGDFPLPGAGSDKEYAIGFFKRGFATSTAVSIVWTWSGRAPGGEPA